MPLDKFQEEVVRFLSRNRSPDSVLAGGTVLQRHGFRLSGDQDIFHPPEIDVASVARKDIELLQSAGYAVEVEQNREGIVEAVVARGTAGRTKIQWVQASAYNFFRPVPDPDFGWRAHYADLSVNKALAAADRRQVRDLVDLYFIDRHVLPLWHVLWAAPGKDETWSPNSILERISGNRGTTQEELDASVLSVDETITASEIGVALLEAIDLARDVFPSLPSGSPGCLFVHGETGEPVQRPIEIGEGDVSALRARPGGAWPSTAETDSMFVRRLVDQFGENGSKLTGGKRQP